MVSATDHEHCGKLAETLWEQAVNGVCTDVILQYGETKFNAHSCVLRMYPVFFEIWKQSSNIEQDCPSLDARIFWAILKFLYTGNIEIPEDWFTQVEHFSVKNELSGLTDLCKIYQQNANLLETSDLPVEEPLTVVVDASPVERSPSKRRRRGSRKCLECKETFAVVSELSEHYAMHQNETPANFCKICGVEFTKDIKQNEHVCYWNDGSKPEALECPYCLLSCQTINVLREHENLHKCENCDKIFDTVASRNVHVCGARSEKTVYDCTICGKSYKSKMCFINHLKVHNGTNKFICQFCDKTFLHYLPLKNHMMSHTEGSGETYRCRVCGDTFRLKVKFYRHCIQLGHALEDVPYRCKICQRLFVNDRDLSSHVRVHYPEKPFKCRECHKRYSSTLGLKLHIRSIHLKELPFQCPDCGTRFAQSSHLADHKRTHTQEKNHVCSHCGSRFASKVNLQRHERKHTQHRDFACSECSKSYHIPQDLERHIKRSHRNGKKSSEENLTSGTEMVKEEYESATQKLQHNL